MVLTSDLLQGLSVVNGVSVTGQTVWSVLHEVSVYRDRVQKENLIKKHKTATFARDREKSLMNIVSSLSGQI